MNTNRRTFLVGTGLVLGTASAGCAALLGDEPIAFEADPATVPEATTDETGYESAGVRTDQIERELEAAGQSRTVQVTNQIAEYEKSVDLGPIGERRAAIFTVLSTPQVEVLGRTFNPVADMSTADLVDMLQDQYEGLEDVERESEGTVTIAGTETTQTKFVAETQLAEGETIDTFLHVSEPVESGDDLLVTVGGYPRQLEAEEEDNVLAMMEGVEHESE